MSSFSTPYFVQSTISLQNLVSCLLLITVLRRHRNKTFLFRHWLTTLLICAYLVGHLNIIRGRYIMKLKTLDSSQILSSRNEVHEATVAFHFTRSSSFGCRWRHVCHSHKGYTFIVIYFRTLSSLLGKETRSFLKKITRVLSALGQRRLWRTFDTPEGDTCLLTVAAKVARRLMGVNVLAARLPVTVFTTMLPATLRLRATVAATSGPVTVFWLAALPTGWNNRLPTFQANKIPWWIFKIPG